MLDITFERFASYTHQHVGAVRVLVTWLLLTGTVFYTIVERWRPLDALYFSVTTLATVGFGDYAPQTDIGKVFTIVYILAGIGVIVAFANAVLERAGAAQREKLERAARPQYPDPET